MTLPWKKGAKALRKELVDKRRTLHLLNRTRDDRLVSAGPDRGHFSFEFRSTVATIL